jgi:hypothetical protein
MALTAEQVQSTAKELHKRHEADRGKLDDVRRYATGRQRLPDVIPAASPVEVKEMARIARVNVIDIVVESLTQSLFVEGFRGQREADNSSVWDIWQANRLDARQAGIHRAALAYGTAYAVVLPGDPVPVIRGVSPRKLIAEYGDDPDWPVHALERRSKTVYRLYDDAAVYVLRRTDDAFELTDQLEHRSEVTPIVRYLDREDLDDDDEPSDDSRVGPGRRSRLVAGQVAPLMSIQDQIDLITFNLLIAQHYAAFRQRWAIGWVPDSEDQKAKVGAARMMTFDEDPERMKLGEFEATNLEGYIKSREASLRHAATLSQTPAHELIGELINLSAEALAAAEASRDRKVDDRQTVLGEAHEQTLRLAAALASIEVPDGAQVIWRDTSARSFAAIVDGLGKLATMLGVPARELWERIPGVSQQDVERWRASAGEGDAFANLQNLLERQAGVAAGAAGGNGAGL